MRTAPPAPRRRRPRAGRVAGWLVVALLVAAGLGGWAWWNGSVGNVPVREHCTAVASGTATQLDPEQAGNAGIIASIAVRRELPARAATIGIATAIQESKLRNIEYGDRDSLGLFQQRPSQGWGEPAEILDAVYSTNAFYDALVKIDGYEDMVITEVAQEVQRSGFPEAYADHEPEGRVLASALSGYSPAGFNCVLRSPSVSGVQEPDGDGFTARAAALAEAAATETGERRVEPVGDDGRSVMLIAAAGEEDRRAWSLAHWAVARAAALDVVEVRIGDRQWTRASSTDGWTQRTDALPEGQVVVRVA